MSKATPAPWTVLAAVCAACSASSSIGGVPTGLVIVSVEVEASADVIAVDSAGPSSDALIGPVGFDDIIFNDPVDAAVARRLSTYTTTGSDRYQPNGPVVILLASPWGWTTQFLELAINIVQRGFTVLMVRDVSTGLDAAVHGTPAAANPIPKTSNPQCHQCSIPPRGGLDV